MVISPSNFILNGSPLPCWTPIALYGGVCFPCMDRHCWYPGMVWWAWLCRSDLGSGLRQVHLACRWLEGRNEQKQEATECKGKQEAELADTHWSYVHPDWPVEWVHQPPGLQSLPTPPCPILTRSTGILHRVRKRFDSVFTDTSNILTPQRKDKEKVWKGVSCSTHNFPLFLHNKSTGNAFF